MTTIQQQIDIITSNIQNMKVMHLEQINSLNLQVKTLEKLVKKELKTPKKLLKNNESKVRKPSGFATPSKVSSELCTFLNTTEGTEIARTEVTKAVVSYIKEKSLQSKSDKKNIIVPDEKLKMLLGLDDNEELTYFSLQKHMNKHFLKSKQTEDVAVEMS